MPVKIASNAKLSLRATLILVFFALGFIIYGAWSFKTLNELKNDGKNTDNVLTYGKMPRLWRGKKTSWLTQLFSSWDPPLVVAAVAAPRRYSLILSLPKFIKS